MQILKEEYDLVVFGRLDESAEKINIGNAEFKKHATSAINSAKLADHAKDSGNRPDESKHITAYKQHARAHEEAVQDHAEKMKDKRSVVAKHGALEMSHMNMSKEVGAHHLSNVHSMLSDNHACAREWGENGEEASSQIKKMGDAYKQAYSPKK